MKLEAKIERIKTEIRFLTEGAGTLEEKADALAEIDVFAQAQFNAAVQAAEQAAAELQTLQAGDVGGVSDVLGA